MIFPVVPLITVDSESWSEQVHLLLIVKTLHFSVVFIVESDYKAKRRKSDSCGQSDREIIGHRGGRVQL